MFDNEFVTDLTTQEPQMGEDVSSRETGRKLVVLVAATKQRNLSQSGLCKEWWRVIEDELECKDMNFGFVDIRVDDRLATNEHTAIGGDSFREHNDRSERIRLTFTQQITQRNSLNDKKRVEI